MTLSVVCMAASLVVMFAMPFDPDSVLNWVGFAVNAWSDLGSMVANTAELAARTGRTLLLAVSFALGAWCFGRSRDGRPAVGRRLAVALASVAVVVLAIGFVMGARPIVESGFGSFESTRFALHAVDLDLDVDPRSGTFRSSGTLELSRYGAGALAVWGGPSWQSVHWTLDGQPVEPTVDSVRNFGRRGASDRCYRFGDLPQGAARASVGFVIAGDLSATEPWSSYFVRPAGTVLDAADGSFMPGLQRPHLWIPADPVERDQHRITEPLFGNRVPFTARVRLTSPADYVFNTVGELLDERVADGRRTRSFATDYPVVAMNVVGARYAVRRGGLAEI
jgi:hypothetical protein